MRVEGQAVAAILALHGLAVATTLSRCRHLVTMSNGMPVAAARDRARAKPVWFRYGGCGPRW